MNSIGDRLRHIRKSQPNKMSQEEFGASLGITRGAYMMYELDKVIPPPATMRLICLTYNVNERWLETGEGEPFIKPPEDVLIEAVKALMPGADMEDVLAVAALTQMPREWWDLFRSAVERERAKLKG